VNVKSVIADKKLPIIINIIENLILRECFTPKKYESPIAVIQSPKFLNTVIIGTGNQARANPDVESIKTNNTQAGIHLIKRFKSTLNFRQPNFRKIIIKIIIEIY